MDLKTEGARTLMAYWHSQKGEHRLPLSTKLDLVDLAPILAHMVIYEFEDDDFSIRFFGTELVRRLGVDLTGIQTSAYADRPFGKIVVDHLTQVVAGPAMLVWNYQSQSNEGPLIGVEQLMLPWADETGQARCVVSLVSRTSGDDATVTHKLEKSFKGATDLQTINL